MSIKEYGVSAFEPFWNSGSRRHFLTSQAMGLGSVALSWLLDQDAASAAPDKPVLEREVFDLLPKQPQVEPTARARS